MAPSHSDQMLTQEQKGSKYETVVCTLPFCKRVILTDVILDVTEL